MAKRLFESGNYLIAVIDGEFNRQYEKKFVKYSTSDSGYRIIQTGIDETVIETVDIVNWITSETGSGTYTEAALTSFLRSKTGLCCPDFDKYMTYQELWSSFSASASGSWVSLTITGITEPTLLLISIDPNANNTDIGVREVGSVLNRVIRVDQDSVATFTVKTDETGQIEVFTSNVNATFYVQSVLF